MNKKIIFVIGFIIGAIIFGGLGVYAASEILASSIKYNNTTVDAALNDLYSKIDDDKVCMFISNQYGNKGQIGAKYACNPGDGKIYYFYILAKSGNNVKLLMDRNISDTVGSNVTMGWSDATTFFDSGKPGYATAQAWNKVAVSLPEAQDIVDASLVMVPKNDWSFDASTSTVAWFCLGSHVQDQPSGPLFCPSSANQQKVAWLFDYTRACSTRGCEFNYTDTAGYPYGYWTNTSLIDTSKAWFVQTYGNLGNYAKTTSNDNGVRPVITVSASQI